jgi:hypothetical protein
MLGCCLAKVAGSVEPVGIFGLEIENSRLDSKKVIESELEGREGGAGSSNSLLDEYPQGKNLRIQDGDRLVGPYRFDKQRPGI